jgi:hypothetical protein
MMKNMKTDERGTLTLLIIFIFLYVLNYLTPLGVGDDYLYSFIWQGNAMNVPLPANAARVSSVSGLLASQWSHYLTWGGRSVAHTVAQFFLWKGKGLFNFANAFVGTLLVAEIYWCIHKGKVSFSFEPKKVFWIFFALWAFTPGFTPVFLWLTGACNYLWTCVMLLGFMVPFIKKYYFPEEQAGDNVFFTGFMFFFGILSGWTNENSVCWIILVLFLFLLRLHKHDVSIHNWMYAGLAGLIIGYLLLVLSPGNVSRLHLIHGTGWDSVQFINANCSTFFKVMICQFFLWYFVLRFLYEAAHKSSGSKNLKKELLFVSVLGVTGLGSSAIMLMAPEFPERSGFFGTVWLIIAAGVMWQIQEEYKLDLIRENAKKFLTVTGVFYLVMTSVITLHNFYETNRWHQELLLRIQQEKRENKNSVLPVRPFRKAGKTEVLMSGFHIVENDLSDDAGNWENVAFARYYGIKGVRTEKDNNNETDLRH